MVRSDGGIWLTHCSVVGPDPHTPRPPGGRILSGYQVRQREILEQRLRVLEIFDMKLVRVDEMSGLSSDRECELFQAPN